MVDIVQMVANINMVKMINIVVDLQMVGMVAPQNGQKLLK